MTVQNCIVTEPVIREAFLAAPPAIAKQVWNLTVKFSSWVSDFWQLEPFPTGQGTQEQQLIMRGQMPPIERDFSKWAKLNNDTGCNPCTGPEASYNKTYFGGTGIERRLMELMRRDFFSQTYDVKQIQTTAHFQQIFAQTVANLYAQIRFFKEQNIGFNYFVNLLKKVMFDSSGPVPNTANPYAYRPLGTAILSALNIQMVNTIYDWMRYQPDAVPYGVQDSRPTFAVECSDQLAADMYLDDPQLRQDLRFSGYANDLVSKYNIMSSWRGMFMVAPILTPRRFYYSAGLTDWVEVFPYVNGVPLEIGDATFVNPNYINPNYATHEEVSFHGMYPFKVKYMPTETSLGENTSFGPEYSFMNAWEWVNPQTVSDPGRRQGFFWTSATIGLAPQYSKQMYGVLVPRKPSTNSFAALPTPTCPSSPVDCNNVLPALHACPCPLITDAFISPVSGNYELSFSVPFDPVPIADATFHFGLDTGGYVVGTVVSAAADGSALELTFPAGTGLTTCDHFTSVFCVNTLLCSATVQAVVPNCANPTTQLDLTLSNPIKAITADDDVTITYGDGTTQSFDVIAVNQNTLVWTVGVETGTICSTDVVSVCVPTATDATCPDCGGVTYTQCAT